MLVELLQSEAENHPLSPLYLLGSEQTSEQEQGCQLVDRLLVDEASLELWCSYRRALSNERDLPEETLRRIVEQGAYAAYLDQQVTLQDLECLARNPAQLREAHERIVEPVRAARRRLLPRNFREELEECADLWSIAELLLSHGQQLKVAKNLRVHHLNLAANKLTCVATAGVDRQFVEQLRNVGGFVKDWSLLPLNQFDTKWPFENGAPTLFQVDGTAAGKPLKSKPGPAELPTVVVPYEQCTVLQGFKGRDWICYPFKVGGEWAGKLSCDVDPKEFARAGFRDDVHAFWELVKVAGIHLDSYARHQLPAKLPAPDTKAAPAEPAVPAERPATAPPDIVEAALRYEKHHGHQDRAAIAAYVVRYLCRRYPGQAIALDGGETNVAIARAIVDEIREGRLVLGTIMTNNVGILSLVPASGNFPPVESTGGRLRSKEGKPGTLLGDEGLIERIREWTFAASIIGSSGIGPPYLFTASGLEHDVKRAFAAASTDVIATVPSFNWGRFSGKHFLDLRIAHGNQGSLFCVSVFPFQDAKEPRRFDQMTHEIRSRFLEGVRQLCSWKTKISVEFAKAEFSPGNELNPTVMKIPHDEQDLDRLEDFLEENNPDRRGDVRLLVCIQLARHVPPSIHPLQAAGADAMVRNR